MSLTPGKPSAVAYMSIGQSKRWNRQPIKTGSSEHDDRVGGGVSLTTVSDFDDSTQATQVPSCSRTHDDNDEKPASPPTNLNGNANPPTSTEHSEATTAPTSRDTSPKSSSSVESSASQSNTMQMAQLAISEEKAAETAILMSAYFSREQRTRSATTSTPEQVASDKPHDHYGHGSFTTRSTPIKYATRDCAAITKTDADVSDAEQDTGKIQQYVYNNTPSGYQYQITRQATSTTDSIAHHQNIQSSPRIMSPAKHRTHNPQLMNNQLPANNAIPVMPSRGVQGQQLNGICYNANAPAFTPASQNNVRFDTVQVSPVVPGIQFQSTQRQGFAKSSVPVMESVQVAPPGLSPGHYRPQMNGFSNGNHIAANPMQAMPFPPGLNYQGHQGNGFFNGIAYNLYGQMQSNAHGNASHLYNQPYPPPTYGANHQLPQEQVRENAMSYSHQPWKHCIGNGAPSMPINGQSYQESKPHNTPSAPAYGYKYGLTGSASDGSMSQYYANGQPNGQPHGSKDLVPLDREPAKVHATVGPLDFEVPRREIMAKRSEMLQALTENGRPSLQDLFDPKFIPFVSGYRYSTPSAENGVVVVRNIPYETTRSEIIALLGKTSKILNDRQEPVHIIMDRVTSKTQDAFCELSSLDAAIEIVDRFRTSAENGRISRLGNRVVEVELSSQTILMETLFPSSRNGVKWIGAHPQPGKDKKFPWENFSGFFTEEEMVMLCKHVENSQRSLYGKICPERPYECMISTLRKIPWYMADYITIKQRQCVYEACMKMIGALVGKLSAFENSCHEYPRRGREDSTEVKRLTPQLLDRLVTSAMLCPGFSVVQKHNIATTAGLSEQRSREFNQPRFADSWRHQWTLAPKADMPIDVLEWYISVIRTETNRVVQSLDIYQRMPLQGMMEGVDGYWGFFWAEANFPIGREWDKMSLAECSRLEWEAIERIITRAIQGGNVPPSYTSGSHHINSAPTNGPARLTYREY